MGEINKLYLSKAVQTGVSVAFCRANKRIWGKIAEKLNLLQKYYEKVLTNGNLSNIIVVAAFSSTYGGIAQLARAFGSYPKCRRFKSYFRYHVARWSRG